MPVEHINPTDSLNTGRVKLNAAIDQSNDAITKATSAVATANQAKSTADNVQAQFNQVVIEGDSSVEAAQARVDADGNTYTTLKERLDTKEQSFSAQLADNTNKIGILNKKTEGIVSVKEFGAKGDGVTDDTEAIQNAIDDLNSKGGGTLLFPNGTFLAENIKVYSNIRIKGVHRDLSIIKRPSRSSNDPQYYILYSKDKDIENFSLENITIDGNYKNLGYVIDGQKPTIQDVMIRNDIPGYTIKNIRIHNCRFINGTNEAIGVHGTYVNGDISYDVEDVDVSNCTFKDIYGNAVFIWGKDITVTNNKFYNIDDTAIGLDLSVNTIVTDNIVKYDINHTGYKCLNGACGIAGSFFSQKESIVKDNHVIDYQIPIKVDPVDVTSNVSARLATISDNFVSSPNRSSADGLIRVLGGKKIKIKGNVINAYNKYGHGISVQSNANSINPDDITIEDNYIYDTQRAGIYGTNGADLYIKGNKLVDCGKSGQTFPVDSIYLNGCTGFFITGNKVKNSGRDSIFTENCTNGFITENYTAQAVTSYSTNTNVIKKRNFVANKPTENEGFTTLSGNGSQTTFTIPHGLGVQPKGGVVTPCTLAAVGSFYVSFDATNINITYTTAPPNGTNNLKFSWFVFS